MSRRARFASLVIVLTFEASIAAVFLLESGLSGNDESLLQLAVVDLTAPVESTLGAFALWALAAIAGWFVVTGFAYTLACLSGRSEVAHRIGRFTPRFVRKLADRAVALSLTVAVLGTAGSAAAHESADGGDQPAGTDTHRLAEIPHPGIRRLTSNHEPGTAIATEARPVNPAEEHVVTRGDNLWRIAAAHLADFPQAPIDLRAYWLMVIEANRDHLRSGDPDLIYPGESIVLPRLPGKP